MSRKSTIYKIIIDGITGIESKETKALLKCYIYNAYKYLNIIHNTKSYQIIVQEKRDGLSFV